MAISGRSAGVRLRRCVAALLAIAVGVAFAGVACAETRVALVIGNGGYKAVPALANPPSDAEDVAKALKALGFAVTLAVDADQAKMQSLIADLSKASQTADVTLFYYGGHGLQVNSRNYLLPVDAQLKSVDDIEKHTVQLDDVLDGQAKSPGVHLIFLDACRTNPVKSGAAALQKGLARVGNQAGFLIAFATQPDNVAFDGQGRNSPFAESLLAHVATPGVDVSSMMIAVRRDVIAATGSEQVPFEASSLTRQFYFAGERANDASPETLLWQLAAGQHDPSLLSIYLDRYPKGSHAGDVRALLAESGASKPAPRNDPSVEDELWRLALGARERKLVDLYLSRYPAGAHVAEAGDLLASLKASEATDKDAAIVCARLATPLADATAAAPGVDLATLAAHGEEAVAACQSAVASHPEFPHYVALLARATLASGHYPEGIELYRKAAAAGDARAMTSLALLMEDGDHMPKDIAGAYALYEKAADLGNIDAAINLSIALAEGKLVEKNVPRAFALLQKASSAGSAVATFDLATLIDQGKGGDPADELGLYLKAAHLGDPRGYRAAAVQLDEGFHAPKDPERSADAMLRCVTADAGDCLAELLRTPQTWSAPTMKAIQTRLKQAGYYKGALDGRVNAAMAPALKQWRQLGPPAT